MSEKNPGTGELRLRLTVPYVLHEVLAVVERRGSRGVSYDPLSTRNPVPWSSDCPECRAGKVKAPLKVRRAIQAMCTAKMTSPTSYTVQVVVGKDARYYLSAARGKNNGWSVRSRSAGSDPHHKRFWNRVPPGDTRNPVLRRTVSLLLSAREDTTAQTWCDDSSQRMESPHPHAAPAASRS